MALAAPSQLLGVALAVVLLLHTATGRQAPTGEEPAYVKKLTSGYLSNTELVAYVTEFTTRCSAISRLITFGISTAGNPLVAIEISGKPGADTQWPQVKYVANIHGNEPSGRQLLLLLAEKLCAEYQLAGSPAQQLVSKVRLFLVPTLNPDGFATHQRSNQRGVDLNRNFPDPWLNPGHDIRQPLGNEQAETLSIMNFTLANRFVASLAFHEGALVANYPFDGYADGSQAVKGVAHKTTDDATFRHLSTAYAHLHTRMATDNKEFQTGITNGAQWYPLYGGMQDWNYLAANCMEVTLELNDDKWPLPPRLGEMWRENEVALTQWPLQITMSGLHGKVLSKAPAQDGSNGLVPLEALVRVEGQALNVTSTRKQGAYFRPLAPGTYTVHVEAEAHQPRSATVTIPRDGSGLAFNWELLPLSPPPPPPLPSPPPSPPPLVEQRDEHAGNGAPGNATPAVTMLKTVGASVQPMVQGASTPLLAWGGGTALLVAAVVLASRAQTGWASHMQSAVHQLMRAPQRALPLHRPATTRTRAALSGDV